MAENYSYDYTSYDPSSETPGSSGSGNGLNGRDALSAAAKAAQAYLEYQQQERDRQDRERGMTSSDAFQQKWINEHQWDREANAAIARRGFENTEAQKAVEARSLLNRAPMADKAQALLLSRMGVAPNSFRPRDYTQGTAALSGTPNGGPDVTSAALQTAAAGYKPGDGGVDVTALQALLDKMWGSSGMAPVPNAARDRAMGAVQRAMGGPSAATPVPNAARDDVVAALRRMMGG